MPRKTNPNSLKNLKPIQKGEVRNPLGEHAKNPIKKALRNFTNEYLKEVIEIAVMGDRDALRSIVADPNAPAIKVGVAQSLLNAISRGDYDLLDRVVARIIGKVPDKIDHTVSRPQVTVALPGNTREAPKDGTD